MLEEFINYYGKAKKMQELKFEGKTWNESDVNDNLVWNIPIYDVVNRKYAAFSSLLEAVVQKENDPKGNGKHFKHLDIPFTEFVSLCYLFRLCGSGINYKPKQGLPFGSHGFGNFWIVDLLTKGITDRNKWIDNIPDKGFCDVKGYLLPMIPKGLKNFILEDSFNLVDDIINEVQQGGYSITDVVDLGNHWLKSRGFKRQNFVLTAFAMDMAEYFPNMVDRNSDVYVGSNAKKCLKLIMPGVKDNDALRHLCELTNHHSKLYDMEDVACDFIRYIENFQSVDHIKLNKGIKYTNNVLK
mgnify:CR=1 FL=1|tara:strand:- start:3395 stop:4288 length:894 start_codon:yes stop_codon:yes gene_type:complete